MLHAGPQPEATLRTVRVNAAWPALLVLGLLAVNAASVPASVAAAGTAAIADSLGAFGAGRPAVGEAVEREPDGSPADAGAGARSRGPVLRASLGGAGVVAPAAGRETDLPPPWA